MIGRVNEVYGDNIETRRDIQNIIDSLFVTTQKIIKVQFFIFIFGYMAPFILQLFYAESNGAVIALNTLCLITQIFFIFIEGLQMRNSGWKYFKVMWNIIDLSLFLVYCIYYINRMTSISQGKILILP